MRKNINRVRIIGYLYDVSKMVLKVSGENSKNPGTEYIAGEMQIAIDEDGMEIIPVHFTYVTATYSSGKPNNNFAALKKIIETPCSWLDVDKAQATMVQVDGSFGINDFVASDGSLVAQKRVDASFIKIIPSLPEKSERSKYEVDMLISRTNRIEANPEKGIEEDYLVVGGAIFDFRNAFLPYEFIVRNEEGITYFEDMEASNAEPVYIKVWGEIVSRKSITKREEETAFGGPHIEISERITKEYVITSTLKVPYEFGEEGVMTAEELTQAIQNREVHLAEVQKRNEEYQASRNASTPAPAVTAPQTAPSKFKF